jgi:hypothetical protein
VSISVTVTLAETVQVDASTDAAYTPDLMSDVLARAREAAIAAWDALDIETSDET